MYSVIIQPEALLDLQESYDWYEDQRAGLGNEFEEEVQKGFLQIITNPLYYTFISKNLRRYRIKRFPFLIIFGVEKNKIIVTGIRHMSRKPSQ